MNKLIKWLKREPEIVYVDKPVSFEVALEVVAREVSNMGARELLPEAVIGMFKEMATIEGIDDYFRDTLNADLARHFSAVSDHDRDIVMGGFARTSYLWNKIKGART